MKRRILIALGAGLLVFAAAVGNIRWTQVRSGDRHGNGSSGQASDGTGTSGNCVKFDSGGSFTDAASICNPAAGLLNWQGTQATIDSDGLSDNQVLYTYTIPSIPDGQCIRAKVWIGGGSSAGGTTDSVAWNFGGTVSGGKVTGGVFCGSGTFAGGGKGLTGYTPCSVCNAASSHTSQIITVFPYYRNSPTGDSSSIQWGPTFCTASLDTSTSQTLSFTWSSNNNPVPRVPGGGFLVETAQ